MILLFAAYNHQCDQKLYFVTFALSRFKLLVMKCNGERRAHPLCLWKSLPTCLKKTLKILQPYVYAHDLWYFLYFLMWCSNGSFSMFIGCSCSPLGWIGNFPPRRPPIIHSLFSYLAFLIWSASNFTSAMILYKLWQKLRLNNFL